MAKRAAHANLNDASVLPMMVRQLRGKRLRGSTLGLADAPHARVMAPDIRVLSGLTASAGKGAQAATASCPARPLGVDGRTMATSASGANVPLSGHRSSKYRRAIA